MGTPRISIDKNEAVKAFDLIFSLIEKHSEIEPTIWIAAMWHFIAVGGEESGFSYEEFCKEVDNIKLHYKPRWDAKHE